MLTHNTVEINLGGVISTKLEGAFALAVKVLIVIAVLYALYKFLQKDNVSITIA